MAGIPDPLEDADYRALVDALAREGLPRRAEAARAVEAVVCALAQRLEGAEFDDLRELLPAPSGPASSPASGTPPRPAGAAAERREFYTLVAEDLDCSPEEVEPTARAVLAAVRAQLGEGEAEDVAGRLPAELQPLWRRLSVISAGSTSCSTR